MDGAFTAIRRDHFEKEQFDESLTFFVENDYCLRSRCGIVDVLVGHYKNPELYGGTYWPEGQHVYEDSKGKFHAKHNLQDRPESNRECCIVDIDTYNKLGQEDCYKQFLSKYTEVKC